MASRGETPSSLHNNCSGKHAGFLCLACRMTGGRPLFDYAKGYVKAEHPVMREVTQALQTTTGWDLSTAPQRHRRLFDPDLRHPAAAPGAGLRARRHRRRVERRPRTGRATPARRQWRRPPFMVGGTDRFDTRVMQRLGERVFCKVGAEGVYCAALPGRGLGVA